eukprot:TRINITY_DN3417_c6_g1_i1.p2 TRINITY_DN3417_c6_g1~~TRINITY_DN3417_c6_g1_i1.p2  ORF type:complete len:186 (+),score=61.09 TRINITY_DN3417_c6_g1_i1:74-631(+)
MGYAGYSPGMKVAESLTPLEQALRSLPLDKALESLELIEKLTRNVVRNPTDDKFRRIKLGNPKIAAAITDVTGAVDLLNVMGWVQEGEELTLPSAVTLAHEKEVIGIIDAKDWYKKEEEKEKRRQMAARKDFDADKQALKDKMEQDRKEKAAEGPVTRGSVAKKLGDGPNIMRAADLGIGQNSGG